MKRYITDSTETQVMTGACSKVLITVNAAYAGAIKVCDAITGNTANVATITGATVGSRYEYWDFTVGVRIVAAGACDITVNTSGGFGH